MMQEKYDEEFEKYWKKFATQLQGQLMTQAQKGILVHSAFNLTLADCAGFWDSKYSEGGRWLDQYKAGHPEEADMIRDILLKDMQFTDEGKYSSKYGALRYLIPAGSAAAGFIISGISRAGTLARAASTIVPAAVAYPVTANIVNMKADDAKKELIQAYMKQLDKYKRSVESVLHNAASEENTDTI